MSKSILMKSGDYIVYVDESGDHGLHNIDPSYPVFCLTFCIFEKSAYARDIVPAMTELKFKYWGHNDIILHEHDIRKSMSGDYAILNDPHVRKEFIEDITSFISVAPFHIVSTVIRKDMLTAYKTPSNPYELAMTFCMERLHNFMLRRNQEKRAVHVLFESRGGKEDNDLELEFRRICSNEPQCIKTITDFTSVHYHIRFLSKKIDSTGLQIADLVARPIGVKSLRPDQKNKAFAVIEDKFLCHDNGEYRGRGLKEFP